DGRYLIWDKENIVRTESHMGFLDPETGVFDGVSLKDETGWERDTKGSVQGFEDLRLFYWRCAWWALATVRDHAEARGMNEIVLLELSDKRTIAKAHRLCPGTRRCEKNWVPLVDGGRAHILYGIDPTQWITFDVASGTK